MVGLFRRRGIVPSTEELSGLTAAAVEDIKAKWIEFVQTAHVQAGYPLAREIEVFAPSVGRLYKNKYQALHKNPATDFWEIVFAAIQASATHSADEVNLAYEELRTQYELA